MEQNNSKSYGTALYTIITVFFFWGFLAASNVKISCNLQIAEFNAEIQATFKFVIAVLKEEYEKLQKIKVRKQ